MTVATVTGTCCPGPDLRGREMGATAEIKWWRTEYIVMLFSFKTKSVWKHSLSVYQLIDETVIPFLKLTFSIRRLTADQGLEARENTS